MLQSIHVQKKKTLADLMQAAQRISTKPGTARKTTIDNNQK